MDRVIKFINRYRDNPNPKYLELLNKIGFNQKEDIWKYTDISSNILEYRGEKGISKVSSNLEIATIESFDFKHLDFSGTLSLSMSEGIKYLEINQNCVLNLDVVAEKLASTTLVISIMPGINVEIIQKDSGNETVFLPFTYIVLSKNSKVKYTKIQNYSNDSIVLDSVIAILEENSILEATFISGGSKVLRNNLTIVLNRDATADIDGLYYLKQGHLDNNLRVEHHQTSFSKQTYKGVIEKGSGTFNGYIYIAKDADNTTSHQLNKTILLGDEAEINTKPSLEILNGNVECTHGATVGTLSESEIFYMMSRGIDKVEAEKMVIFGFMNEMLQSSNVIDIDKFLNLK